MLPAMFAGLLMSQGETTSAIVGAVADVTGGAIVAASVTAISTETRSRRTAKTDDAGRFSFPQLKPGPYLVTIEADGFKSNTSDAIFSGLGQKQTVNFTLTLAAAKEALTVSGEAPLVNPDNPNTATTLNAPALENLPNPGGDMTYPLQFAAGALINTAGSGNDFVGGTNGYGNVQFNGLPSLANGYIVDGLETNDPLTNLNSGLSTNLVLGPEFDCRGHGQHALVRRRSGPIRRFAGQLRHEIRARTSSMAICTNCGTDRDSMPPISLRTRHSGITSRARR